MPKKDKEQRIRAEEKRLNCLFEACTEKELEFVSKQVQQLAWLNVSIRDLQISIDKTGSTVEYMNGATQYGTRKNPDIDTLVQYQKLANSIASNLAKYIDSDADSKPGNKLAEFLA